MSYYEEYCIHSSEELYSITDTKGCINQDVRIYYDKKWNPNSIKSLGNVQQINGHLNIDELEDLGELKIVKSHIWYSGKKLKTLNNLVRVDGDVKLRNSKINSLGKLKKVGGKLNLRDSKIEDLGFLEYVGGDLYLPKKMENYDLSGIKVKGKIRFWNDTKEIPFYYEYDKTHFSTIHKRELETKKRCLSGKYLVEHCVGTSDLNSFVLRNIKEFFSFLDTELDKFYESHYSFFYILFGELHSHKQINNNFRKRPRRLKKETYSKYMIRNQSHIQFKKYLDVKKQFKTKYKFKGYTNKSWVRYNESRFSFCSSTGRSEYSFIYFIENTILEIFYIYTISLQNDFRVSKGIPKIGEGWVSETELYYLLKDKFPNDDVVHHGKPKWLDRQHVDIWFPKYRVGIEYQGLQHDKPVEHFGGEEGFVKNQERDKKKKKLFLENNSKLIEVRKGYKIEDVVNEIKKNIDCE